MKPRTLARNRLRRLGWLRFLLQLGSVALAYVLASIPPVLIFGETNAGMLGSVVLSMVAALLVARLWLVSDGCLRQAWSIRPPLNMQRTFGLAALGTGIIVAMLALLHPLGVVLAALFATHWKWHFGRLGQPRT